MKIKTINFNQNSSRSRCKSSYLISSNPRCNTIFGIIFIMFITGMFAASIVMALVKARWIDFQRPFYSVYADNTGNDTNIEIYESSQKYFEEITTIKSVNVEEYLDNLSEVYNEQAPTVTTEIFNEKKRNRNFNHQSDSFEDVTAFPNIYPCTITGYMGTHCEITCFNIAISKLSEELKQAINELKEDPNCNPVSTIISLKLSNISFSNSHKEPWLQNTLINVIELIVEESPTLSAFHSIYENSFKSSEFEEMKSLMIYGTGISSVTLDCNNCFNGCNQLKEIVFSNFRKVYDFEKTFFLLKDSLIELEISKIANSFNIQNMLNFSQLTKIEKLNLQENDLSDEQLFIGKVFEMANDNLVEINLSFSSIKKLHAETFFGCKKLKSLYLNNNLLEELPNGIFSDLENVEIIFLQNNKLKTLPDGLFDTQLRTESLTFVNLDDNEWNCDFEILYLKYLLISANQFSNVKCTSPQKYAGHPIKDIWCNINSCLVTCEYTSAMELLASLDFFANNDCEKIELQLKNFEFEGNSMQKNWLNDLEFHPRKLSIIDSIIELIENEAFSSDIFENLEHLVIKSNNGSNFIIEPDAFIGLNNLQIFSIENSQLTFGSATFVTPFKSTLIEMSISGILNPFDPKDIFQQVRLENLRILRLSQNNFEEIQFDSSTFESVCNNIVELYLNYSNVTKVNSDTFSGFKSLKIVNLDGNKLESLESHFFGSNENNNLISISLSNSGIKSLKSDTFYGCSQLEKLDLSDNFLEVLEVGIFDNLQKLTNLNLKNNTLTSIPENLFAKQEKLIYINLLDNLWNCDEKIVYLKNFLINTKAAVEINGCHTPSHYERQDIRELWCNRDSCTLFCDKTNDLILLPVLNAYNMSSCEQIELNLKCHEFEDFAINQNWLQHLNFHPYKLDVIGSNIEKIKEQAFNTETFHNLTTLSIKQNSRNPFFISATGLEGLISLETISIDDCVALNLAYSILQPVAQTLEFVSITNIRNAFSPYFILHHTNYERLKVLNLAGNKFSETEMIEIFFETLEETLEELNFENSGIAKFAVNTFSDFRNLKIINLKGNNVESITGQFFGDSSNKKFINIDLSMSSLTDLSSDSFQGCQLLEVLDLSNNLIQNLKTGTFDDLESLKILNLSNNKLTSIPVNLFNHQSELEPLTINLKDNIWQCDDKIVYLKKFLMYSKPNIIIDGCTNPDKLKNLVIKDLWCRIDECKIECQDTDESILSSVLNIFKTHDCELIELNLKAHSFDRKSVNPLWLSNLTYFLDKLSIKNSSIVNISNEVFNSEPFKNLRELSIRSNSQSTFFIETEGFRGLNSIKTLIIDDCTALTIFSAQYGILSPIRSTLEFVSITNIKTSFEPASIFLNDTFDKMTTLNLNGNNFKNVQFNFKTFAGAHDVLEELNLKSCNIKNLTGNAFAGFKKLKRLNLEDNSLTSLSSETFGNLLEDSFFKILIYQNPWTCSDDLCSLEDFIGDENEVFCQIKPIEGNEYVPIKEACKQTTLTAKETSPTATISPTKNDNTTSEETEPPTEPPNIRTTSTSSRFTTTSKLTTTTEKQETTDGKTVDTSPKFPLNSVMITCQIMENEIESPSTVPPAVYNDPKQLEPYDEPIVLIRVPNWYIKDINYWSENEVLISTSGYLTSFNLVYYPVEFNLGMEINLEKVQNDIKCAYATSSSIVINGLVSGKIYNFCISPIGGTLIFSTPFECRSFLVTKGQPWLYEDHKVIVYTSLSLIIIFTLFFGILVTYCLIRHVPTLIKGSRRVILVNNRGTKDVFILPRNSTQSTNSSIRKESVTPIPAEPPTYLTPLPRQSFDQRPPFVRSSSDTSLKSYVSVSRLPPRFSQVYQRSDFDSDCLKRNGSYPCCAPSCPPSEIPPPLPRRSIVSTASSTQHSNASTAEICRTMSRVGQQNSTYRRHNPCGREPEPENLYNVII